MQIQMLVSLDFKNYLLEKYKNPTIIQQLVKKVWEDCYLKRNH